MVLIRAEPGRDGVSGDEACRVASWQILGAGPTIGFLVWGDLPGRRTTGDPLETGMQVQWIRLWVRGVSVIGWWPVVSRDVLPPWLAFPQDGDGVFG